MDNDISNYYRIKLIRAKQPITKLSTKFGGQPIWYSDPQWPLSRNNGTPMRFLGQILLDTVIFGNVAGKIAYLFVSDDPEDKLATMDPLAGENAVIIQPGRNAVVISSAQQIGPAWEERTIGILFPKRKQIEYHVKLELQSDLAHQVAQKSKVDRKGAKRHYTQSRDPLVSKIGGTPEWIYEPSLPEGGPWRLLMQLEPSEQLNLGLGDAGVVYALLDHSGSSGILLWQTN